MFVDDIIITTKIEDEHIKTFREVLRRPQEKNEYISKEKNIFEKNKVQYPGFDVFKNGYPIDSTQSQSF